MTDLIKIGELKQKDKIYLTTTSEINTPIVKYKDSIISKMEEFGISKKFGVILHISILIIEH